MKAAYIEKPGPPEAIKYGDLPKPTVRPKQVLVRVSAVCVDPVDCYIRSGQLPLDLPQPFVIGRDMVGTVESISPGVTRFSPGNRVWCNNQGYSGRQGTFAEFIVVDESLLYPLPKEADEQQTVAVVHSALTALLGLKRAALRAGETLFMNGGSGNVGSAVLQFAKAAGVRTIATAGSPEGLDWCRSIGVERCVNYRTEDVDRAVAEFAPNGVDVYWDTTNNPDFDQAVARVTRNGRIVLMSGFATRPPFPVGPFYVKNCTLIGFAITDASEADLKEAADQINTALSAGRLRARIDRVLKLSESAAAHRLIEDRVSLAGKIVLTP